MTVGSNGGCVLQSSPDHENCLSSTVQVCLGYENATLANSINPTIDTLCQQPLDQQDSFIILGGKHKYAHFCFFLFFFLRCMYVVCFVWVFFFFFKHCFCFSAVFLFFFIFLCVFYGSKNTKYKQWKIVLFGIGISKILLLSCNMGCKAYQRNLDPLNEVCTRFFVFFFSFFLFGFFGLCGLC